MTNNTIDKSFLTKAYFYSIIFGIILTNIICNIVSYINGFNFFVGTAIATIFLYIIPTILNLMFFKIKIDNKKFLRLPIIFTGLIYGIFSIVIFIVNYGQDDLFFVLPLTIVLVQIIAGLCINKLLTRQINKLAVANTVQN